MNVDDDDGIADNGDGGESVVVQVSISLWDDGYGLIHDHGYMCWTGRNVLVLDPENSSKTADWGSVRLCTCVRCAGYVRMDNACRYSEHRLGDSRCGGILAQMFGVSVGVQMVDIERTYISRYMYVHSCTLVNNIHIRWVLAAETVCLPLIPEIGGLAPDPWWMGLDGC